MTLPDGVADDARRTLAELVGARLEPAEWSAVVTAVDRLAEAAAADDDGGVRESLAELQATAFEARIRRRMPRSGPAAPAVAPTKRTSALPVVGLVCGALVLGVGQAVGGGLVLAGSAVFALFVLVVALAGSRVAAGRTASLSHPDDATVVAPAAAQVAVRRTLAALSHVL